MLILFFVLFLFFFFVFDVRFVEFRKPWLSVDQKRPAVVKPLTTVNTGSKLRRLMNLGTGLGTLVGGR